MTRTRENLANLIAPAGLSPTAANGAPINLLKFARTRTATRAQTFSAVVHVGVFAGLLLLALHPPPGHNPVPAASDGRILFPSPIKIFAGHPSGGGRSGDQNAIPATSGNPPPKSAVQLVRPVLPHNPNLDLPVPPTLLDANAPPVLISIDKIGLPWMPNETNSPGPGKGHGIGVGGGNSMGDSGNGQVGYGDSDGPYAPARSCPRAYTARFPCIRTKPAKSKCKAR